MSWMIRNSKGKKDAILTLVVVGFVVVVAKFALSGMTIFGVTFGDLDAALAGAMLTPTLGAYVVRRHTDARYVSESRTDTRFMSESTYVGAQHSSPEDREDREDV